MRGVARVCVLCSVLRLVDFELEPNRLERRHRTAKSVPLSSELPSFVLFLPVVCATTSIRRVCHHLRFQLGCKAHVGVACLIATSSPIQRHIEVLDAWIMSPPFYYNSDLSTSVVVIFQFLLFVLRESFRGDRDRCESGAEVSRVQVGHAAVVVAECREQTPHLTNGTRGLHTTIGNGYEKATMRLPQVVVVDCSEEDLRADEQNGTHLCHRCMQIKVNGVDRMRDAIKGKDQESKRTGHLFERRVWNTLNQIRGSGECRKIIDCNFLLSENI